jgi:hypothetical protein
MKELTPKEKIEILTKAKERIVSGASLSVGGSSSPRDSKHQNNKVKNFISWLLAEDKPYDMLGTLFLTIIARSALVLIVIYALCKLIMGI